MHAFIVSVARFFLTRHQCSWNCFLFIPHGPDGRGSSHVAYGLIFKHTLLGHQRMTFILNALFILGFCNYLSAMPYEMVIRKKTVKNSSSLSPQLITTLPGKIKIDTVSIKTVIKRNRHSFQGITVREYDIGIKTVCRMQTRRRLSGEAVAVGFLVFLLTGIRVKWCFSIVPLIVVLEWMVEGAAF